MTASKIPIKKVCEFCGKEFTAYKMSTHYCSHRCSNLAYKQRFRLKQIQKHEAEIQDKPIREVSDKAYLSPSEAATLLGINIRSVYNLIYKGILRASHLTSRMTYIRRSDIEAMLEANPYQKRIKPQTSPITDFYTAPEIKEKYGVSEGWIFKVGKEKNIPKVFKRGKTYWSKKHIDQHIVKNRPDQSITEWYTTAEIMAKFQMSLTAVYSFVSKFAIPRKKIKREVFYSKRHVDAAKTFTTMRGEVSTCVSVFLRKKPITQGRSSLYLDFYPAIRNPKTMKMTRREFLGIYIYDNPKNAGSQLGVSV